MNKRKILFLNPVPLIYDGVMLGFQQNGWETYLAEGENYVLGHSVDIQLRMINKYIENYKIDVVFCEFRGGVAWREIFELCDSKGIKFVIFGIEDVPTNTYFVDQTVKYCHYYYTTTEELILYAKTKYNKDIKLLRFGANKQVHKPGVKMDEFTHDIVLCANNYNVRSNDFKDFIMPLIKNKYDIKIWGNEWWLNKSYDVHLCGCPHIYKGYCFAHNTFNLYSSCKIILGLNSCRISQTQTSMRAAEAMGIGAGAIFISPWSPAQERWYGKSGEYAFFPKTRQEMIDNVNYVLSMTDDERIAMSKKAQQFIYDNHNYVDIVKIIINDL